MKRRPNILMWAGFVIVVFALASYIPLFTLFPVTRDIPWANYLLFLIGGGLLAVGVTRAFRDPVHYRGKISGAILSALSATLLGFFLFGTVYFSKQIPSAESALHPGQPAPAFTLQDSAGRQIDLADLLAGHRGAVLVFYRGYW